MPIEFDPATSSYYPVVYTGNTVERPAPEEPPPPTPEQQAAPLPEEIETSADLPPAYEDPALQQESSGYPGGLTSGSAGHTGSIVDEVV
jgi:hypothetical protein